MNPFRAPYSPLLAKLHEHLPGVAQVMLTEDGNQHQTEEDEDDAGVDCLGPGD